MRTPDPEPAGDEPFGPPAGNVSNPAWLSDIELEEARRRLPMLYVEGVPVRTDGMGQVTQVGILLRATPVGEISRTIVSGRVRYGETVRDALFRHLENDLGPMAFPMLPPQPTPWCGRPTGPRWRVGTSSCCSTATAPTSTICSLWCPTCLPATWSPRCARRSPRRSPPPGTPGIRSRDSTGGIRNT